MYKSAILTLFAALAFVFTLAGCNGQGDVTYGDLDLKAFRTGRAQLGSFRVTIDEIGILEARERENYRAPFRGKIRTLASDGKNVQPGDVLVVIDTESLEQDLDQRINDLKIQKADLERTIENLKMQMRDAVLDTESAEAKLQYDRTRLLEVNRQLDTYRALADYDIVAEQEVDSKQMQFSSTRLNVVRSDLGFEKQSTTQEVNEDLKRAELTDLGFRGKETQRRVNEAIDKMQQATITAKSAGTWLVYKDWEWSARRMIPHQPGDEVRQDEFLGEVALGNSIQVMSQVSESMVSYVKEGTPVILTSSALDGAEFQGTIDRVGNAAIERERSAAGSQSVIEDPSGLRVFELVIKPGEDAPAFLKPGMSVDVSIVRKQLSGAVSVPLGAIFRDEGLPVVFVKKAGGAEQRQVVLGARNRERVVIEEGLEGGEEVFLVDLNEKLKELRAQRGRKQSGSDSIN